MIAILQTGHKNILNHQLLINMVWVELLFS